MSFGCKLFQKCMIGQMEYQNVGFYFLGFLSSIDSEKKQVFSSGMKMFGTYIFSGIVKYVQVNPSCLEMDVSVCLTGWAIYRQQLILKGLICSPSKNPSSSPSP